MNWWISMFQRHTGVRYRADSFSSRGHSIYQFEADQTQTNWPVWCKHFVLYHVFLVVAQVSSDPNPGCLVYVRKLYLITPDKYVCFIRKPWKESHDIKRPCFFTENVTFLFFRVWEVSSKIALLGGKGSLLAEVATWWPHSHLIGRLDSGGLVVELRKLRGECWRSSVRVGFYTDTLNLRCI